MQYILSVIQSKAKLFFLNIIFNEEKKLNVDFWKIGGYERLSC